MTTLVEQTIRSLNVAAEEQEDTVCSVDGTFNPPVLSSYAEEILLENKIALAKRQLNERSQLYSLQRANSSEVTQVRWNENISEEFPSIPSLPRLYNSPSQSSFTSDNTVLSGKRTPNTDTPASPDSLYDTSSPSSKAITLHEIATPASAKESRNKACESTTRAARLKRFGGISLGAPKRINPSSDEKDESIPQNPISVENAESEDQNHHLLTNLDKYTNYNKPSSESPSQRAVLAIVSPNRRGGIEKTLRNCAQPNLYENVQQSTVNTDQNAQKGVRNAFIINGRVFRRLELIGRGGSSKVYKVQDQSNKVYAVKKVNLEDAEPAVIDGYKGEIDLLRSLQQEERVVKLVDYEISEGIVRVVMECGEIDLAHVLSARLKMPLDTAFVRFYANEMLKCVKAVHDHGIVHSDLKPANFLLVKGMLKIIDFGIANMVPDYTCNVHRDAQVGTPNYMAPEALLEVSTASESERKFKVGKPLDVWSCGCIIYQMIYGRAPYGGYTGTQRMLAIMNPNVQIAFNKSGLGDVRVPNDAIELVRSCLIRNPTERVTIEDALSSSFLCPQNVNKEFVQSLLQNAIDFGLRKNGSLTSQELEHITNDVWMRIQSLNI